MLKGRTKTFGIVSTAFAGFDIMTHAYTRGVVDGILRTAEEHDYNVTIFTRRWTTAEECEDWLQDYAVEGLLILAPNIHSDLPAAVKRLGIPAVATSGDAEVAGIPTVDSDNDLGVELAVEHLIALGHRRIAHLAGLMSQPTAIMRRDAFYRVMTHNGLDVPEPFLVECGYNPPEAKPFAARLLARQARPTAIFCANDAIALTAIEAAQELDIEVPEQLSIIGYDDTLEGRFNSPALTTVRQPFQEMGRMAANLLLQQMMMGRSPEMKTHILPPELIVRGTTAPLIEL